MAKKFANILGLSNVFGYNSETNTYLPYLLLDSVKNDINYNTICFVEADENDEGLSIGKYDIKSGDTFIITQKGVFAVVPKNGFKSNSDDSLNGLRPIYINNQNIADTFFEYIENDETKEYTPGGNYKLNLEDSEYLTISSLCKDHDENIISCKYELDKEKLDKLYKISTQNTNNNISINEGKNGKEIIVNGYNWNPLKYSFSEGDNTYAEGYESHAEGEETYAKGECSHAEGYGTLANGNNSHAEGAGYMNGFITQEIVIKEFIDETDESSYFVDVLKNTSVDFNYFTDFNDILLNGATLYNPSDTSLENAIGEIIVSKYIEGYDTMPTGMYLKINFYDDYSFESLTDQDGGKLSVAVLRSGAYGTNSHSEGYLTLANGNASHSEGDLTLAYGNASHSEGESTVASGQASHTEGYHNISNGDYSHSEGESTVASGQASHTEGSNTKAYGSNSHAEGTYTMTVGEASHTEGSNTKAYGSNSHAEGHLSEANGAHSHAEGHHTVTNNTGEHAEGRYNLSTYSDSYDNEVPEYTTISSIGIGSDNDSRANAVEVMLNGDVYIKGIGGYDGTNPINVETKTLQDVINSGDNTNGTNGNYLPLSGGNMESTINFPWGNENITPYISFGSGSIKPYDTYGLNINVDDTNINITNGLIETDGSIEAIGFYDVSDIRKKDVQGELSLDKAYDFIRNCEPILYNLKGSDKTQIGLIAQEVREFFPEIVNEDSEGYLSLDYAKLTVIILRVLKDLIDKK